MVLESECFFYQQVINFRFIVIVKSQFSQNNICKYILLLLFIGLFFSRIRTSVFVL